jgi:serine protease Do
LGVGIQDLSKELIDSFTLENSEGVLIAQIYEDSPAQKFGLKRGDVLVEMDGKAVKDVGQFRNMIALTMPGTEIDLTVIRKGKHETLNVTLGNIGESEPDELFQSEMIEKLGFKVQNLTQELATQFGYHLEQGVLISNVA